MLASKPRLIGGPRLAAAVLALTLALAPALSFGQLAASADIPFHKTVLDNGLTVIVHEDHKTPIVAFNVWYHVGSKNEKPGKTGFAHLFEHLMFNGSENHNEDYFPLMEKIGATDLNGTTSEDRTNYFENVPATALEVALWAESDRMGHLLGAVTQAKLDEQRGVVQNEKRQYENEPYALADELIAQACFPKGHPYSWTVIGSMEDLSAASLSDVHE
ncbi:MAG: insulinase family protein, partial [Acidobacteria bacterium]|nr:insulinase family protein [Acidobacteriota bacterium]